MITIDKPLDEIESWDPAGGSALKPGMHEVQIIEVKLEDAKSGYQKVNMKCKAVAGECVGSTVYVNRSLHPNALGYFRGMLAILGCYATTQHLDEQKLVGKYMRVFVEEVPKTDGSGMTVKVDKMFISEVNAEKNLPTDIAEGANAKPIHSVPQHSAPVTARPVAGGGNNRAASPRQAPPEKVDDLPF